MLGLTILFSILLASPGAEAAGSCSAEVASMRSSSRQIARQDLIQNYAERNLRSTADNQAWIDAAYSEGRQGLYVEITASLLKQLNDEIIRNKDLVTAIVNLRKEIDVEILAPLLEAEGVEIYSDFKTVRIFVPASPAQQHELSAQFQRAFVAAETEFQSRMRSLGVVRGSDLSQLWFQMGVATSADLASYAARKAKVAQLLSLELITAEGRQGLNDDLELARVMYRGIRQFSLWDYLFSEGDGGLSLRIVEIYRQNRDRESLAEAIRVAYGYEVSAFRAQQLVEFFEHVDLFSPSLIVAERTMISADNAPFGAFSLDFIGLGAKNLLATIEGVLSATSINDVMPSVRSAEQRVTEAFESQKDQVRQAVADYFADSDGLVSFSGDEGLIVAPRKVELEDMLALQRAFMGVFEASHLRMTFTPINTDGFIDTELMSIGEAIEKKLKSGLSGRIDPALLLQTQFNIYVHEPLGEGSRVVELLVFSEEPHSDRQRAFIRAAFSDVVLMMQAESPEVNIEPATYVRGILPETP
jgi:hypothetical protein